MVIPLLAADAAEAGDGDEITACADPPAWTYMVRDKSGDVRRSSSFFSLEMLEAAANDLNRTVRFSAMPWARCLLEVEAGRVDFALGAYYSQERALRFVYSIPYIRGTPQVFYARSRPVHILNREDLRRYRGCGLNGGSYEHYGLTAKDLDLGINTYEKLMRKLHAGRCDYFVEELEEIAGYGLMGKDYLSDPALMHAPVLGVTAPAAHLIAGRATRAAALLPQIDLALHELIRSGLAEKFWRRHGSGIRYQPP